MAGFYAVLAGFGDGLHVLAHVQSDSALEASLSEGVISGGGRASCCDCGCLFGQLGRKVSLQRSSSAASLCAVEPAGDHEEQSPPHDHDCEICKLLSQLKVASRYLATSPVVVATPVEVCAFSDRLFYADVVYAFAARGPPNLA